MESGRPPRTRSITCQELAELVTDYLEGGLPAADRARFEGHLALCPECQRYVEQMRQVVAALGHVPPEPIPSEIEAKLLQRFRDWKREAGSGRRTREG